MSKRPEKLSKDKTPVIRFTPEQKVAIEHGGESLLVSAAAGSGKTKVLVERIIRRVCSGDDADINQFLVITYTRAAALELKERIRDELMKRIAKQPQNARLRRQLVLFRSATIGTIHKCCEEILRENSHMVGLSSDFRIADDAESGILKRKVLEDVIDGSYENLDKYPGFEQLLDNTVFGSSDRLLAETVIDIHAKLKSTPNPKEWINRKIAEIEEIDGIVDVSGTVSGTYLMVAMREELEFCKEEYIKLQADIDMYPVFSASYGASVDASIDKISRIISALEEGWDEASGCLAMPDVRAKPVRNDGVYDDIYDELKARRKTLTEEVKRITANLHMRSDELVDDLKESKPSTIALLSLVRRFDDAYEREKLHRNIVDFAGLEHMALFLLYDWNINCKTKLAESISDRYVEILVDEYQDVNAAQDAIFSAISRNGENIFMVGDVKQSIYRFRLAEPNIFISKSDSMSEISISDVNKCSQDRKGSKIYLSKNFRSTKEVLSTVNKVFRNIMSRQCGEVDYSASQELVCGRTTEADLKDLRHLEDTTAGKKGKQGILPEYVATAHDNALQSGEESAVALQTDVTSKVEFDIVSLDSLSISDDDEAPESIEIEAAHVANRVKSLLESDLTIPDDSDDSGGVRNIRESDIAILLETISGKAWRFSSALKKVGINATCSMDEGYFDTFEINIILPILFVINNPDSDIHTASVLRSVPYCFSLDELAMIRLQKPDDSYYSAIKSAADGAKGSSELARKCALFLSAFEKYRQMATDIPTHKLIWYIYNNIGLIEFVSSMPGGAQRVENLVLLSEYAYFSEQTGYRGLYSFLSHIETLRQQKRNIVSTIADTSGASSDAVSIMSIHKSKGLEFPVVIIAGAGKGQNLTDTRKNVLFHESLGIGTSIVDSERRVKRDTLTKKAIAKKMLSETRSERLRVLYVAMTRAREKLIITSASKNFEKLISKVDKLPKGKLNPSYVSGLPRMADFLLAGLQDREDESYIVNCVEAADVISVSDKLISLSSLDAPPLHRDALADQTDDTGTSEHMTGQSETSFEYKYAAAENIPSKLTVTAIKELAGSSGTINTANTDSDVDSQAATWVRGKTAFRKPKMISGVGKLTQAERGSLLHTALQFIDYNKCSTREGVKAELNRLCDEGKLTHRAAGEIDADDIVAFYNSDICRRLRASDKVYREFKFSMLSPGERYFAGGGDDEILIQGIIDCFFTFKDGCVVLDFKSDRVTEETVFDRAMSYKPQLDVYAEAVSRILKMNVKERVIYFTATRKAVLV